MSCDLKPFAGKDCADCAGRECPDGDFEAWFTRWVLSPGPDSLRSVARAAWDAARASTEPRFVRGPLGSWTLGGDWHHNPRLQMSAAEQRANNEAAGYRCPGNDGRQEDEPAGVQEDGNG